MFSRGSISKVTPFSTSGKFGRYRIVTLENLMEPLSGQLLDGRRSFTIAGPSLSKVYINL